jgi:hypothetical protein
MNDIYLYSVPTVPTLWQWTAYGLQVVGAALGCYAYWVLIVNQLTKIVTYDMSVTPE